MNGYNKSENPGPSESPVTHPLLRWHPVRIGLIAGTIPLIFFGTFTFVFGFYEDSDGNFDPGSLLIFGPFILFASLMFGAFSFFAFRQMQKSFTGGEKAELPSGQSTVVPVEEKFKGLARPPRAIPLPLRLRLFFGGRGNQIGWLLSAGGAIFFWVFVMSADLTSFIRFSGTLETLDGVVTSSWETNFSVGGSAGARSGEPGYVPGMVEDEGTSIYANAYFFTGPDGRQYDGVSFAEGRRVPEGNSVTIEFPEGTPSVSRIQGMRRKPWGPTAALVVLVPLAGVLTVVYGFRKGLKAQRLLKTGLISSGKRTSGLDLHKLVFEFEAIDGRPYEAVINYPGDEERGHLVDNAEERVVYDPKDPSRYAMFDTLPGSPQIDKHGYYVGGGLARALGLLLAPLATFIGHGACIVFRIGGV